MAPTVGEMLISLSLSTMSMRVPRWPMSLSASSERPAHERRVAHHDRDPLVGAVHVTSQRQALADGEAGARVAAVEDVVGALAAAREAAHAAHLAERREVGQAAGQQLVGVGLVAGVPHDVVRGAVEEPVQDHGQLHHPERAAQVAAGLGDGADDGLADLLAQLRQLVVSESLQVPGTPDTRKDGQRVAPDAAVNTAFAPSVPLAALPLRVAGRC